ncbi:LysR substrate-binding domain-containing protein [Acinetobacter baumannii]|uniref:LysR substrate-binding domain-containing protein n=1 Tax=Acinetobacter baumannii TaxID=470 RepID=UPI002941C535|nr:LysR substrate-binding domain-containing protein [Acinetobacter baumannii]
MIYKSFFLKFYNFICIFECFINIVFGTRQKLDYYFKTIAAEPLVIAEMNAIAPIIELVRNTDLAGIVAKTAIHDNSDVCAIPLENPRPTRTTGLLWKKGKTDETVVKEFTNVIRNVLNCTSLYLTPHSD